jgi:hypothetical protein
MKTIDKAKLAISRIAAKEQVSLVRQEIAADDDDWFRVSAKAYSLHLQAARKQRKEYAKKRNVATTSNEEIGEILELNEKLSAYAVCLPTLATKSDIKAALFLLPQMPQTESQLLLLIENMTLEPRVRALQNIGRVRHFAAFKEFANLVEAATLCYYRGNFASAYLTLVPVIEGIILRWSGYQGIGDKPEFEEIRKFFGSPHVRETPCFTTYFAEPATALLTIISTSPLSVAQHIRSSIAIKPLIFSAIQRLRRGKTAFACFFSWTRWQKSFSTKPIAVIPGGISQIKILDAR